MVTLVDLDAVEAGLRVITDLRWNVDKLFETLTLGAGGSKSESTNGQLEDTRDDEQFINQIYRIIDNFNVNLRKMETCCESLAQAMDDNVNFGILTNMAQDFTHDQDGPYRNILTCYRWFDRMHDYTNHCFHFYNMNSYCTGIYRGSDTLKRLKGSKKEKKAKRIIELPGPPWASYSGIKLSTSKIDKIFNKMAQLVPNIESIEIKRPFGNETIIIITLDKVLKGLILLHGMVFEYVNVKGINEKFTREDG